MSGSDRRCIQRNAKKWPEVIHRFLHERGQKLIDALLEGKHDAARKLLAIKRLDELDFTVENRGDNPLHLAARLGRLELIQLMQEVGENLQRENLHGNTAMHFAARGGYIDVVKYLKANRCQLNPLNDLDGDSPLHKAVTTQTMETIETLADLGMNPNVVNKKNGNTPLHSALECGAQEAMEALLIKGANPELRNFDKKKPEDVAKHPAIRESLRMYKSLLMAMSHGNIRAKGIKITREQVAKPYPVDRVGVIIASIDIPTEFPTGFYCRREKVENSTIQVSKREEEAVISDVYHIRIFEVNRNCVATIQLPVYRLPSEKEQMMLRFIESAPEDRPLDNFITNNKMHYCPLEVTLVPETTCVCFVIIRPRKEESTVSASGTTVTSDMEKAFTLEVPAGTFEENTVLSLQVYETNDDDTVEEPEDDMVGVASDKRKQDSSIDKQLTQKKPDTPPNIHNQNLITDVYQINVKGKQPKKEVLIQIPLCKGMTADDDIVIVRADENELQCNENALEILPEAPRVVNFNLIFEVSHFSIYVASWKKKVTTVDDRCELQRQISSTREKQKPAALFVVVRKDDTDPTGLRHIILVECVLASKSFERRQRWELQDFEGQNPPETGAIMMTPGDTFIVNVEGNSALEDATEATERKLQFLQCRPSFQAYRVLLHEGIYDPEEAFGHVIISKKTDTGIEEAARLRIKLQPPPPPPPPTPQPHDRLNELLRKQPDYRPAGSVSRTIKNFFFKDNTVKPKPKK